MTRILTLALLTGCVATTRVSTSFQLTSIETSECVWVVRNNSRFISGPVYDAQGQDYLYLCCPSDSGQEPRCLTPKWTYPSNDLRIGDPPPASKPEPKAEKPKPTAPPVSGSDLSPF
jgi:hypothetical protein